jgi:hypothetical protein
VTRLKTKIGAKKISRSVQGEQIEAEKEISNRKYDKQQNHEELLERKYLR